MPQSLAKIYVHVIFSTKDREPVLVDEWRDEPRYWEAPRTILVANP
jgi:hypothetical protein